MTTVHLQQEQQRRARSAVSTRMCMRVLVLCVLELAHTCVHHVLSASAHVQVRVRVRVQVQV